MKTEAEIAVDLMLSKKSVSRVYYRLLGMSPGLGYKVEFAPGTNLRCREDPKPGESEPEDRLATMYLSAHLANGVPRSLTHLPNFTHGVRASLERVSNNNKLMMLERCL